jgi:AAA ATPase domain
MPLFSESRNVTIFDGNFVDIGGGIHFHERSDQNHFPDLVNKLPSSPARYDSRKRSFASRCLLGTRVELLRMIDTWINDDNLSHPRIFWLNGLAGTGKSTIAQTIAEQCDRRKILGASFFFDRQDARCSNPKLLFTTIAHQLAWFSPDFLKAIAEAVEASRDPTDTAVEAQLRDFIIAPLSKASQRPPLLIVVIDALDEGDNHQGDIRQLIRLLGTKIHKVPFPLKFFITSRPEPAITAELSLPLMKPVSQVFILHNIDSLIVQDDIRRFLEHHLAVISPSPDWPSSEQLNALISKAAGLFIFAKTSLDFIGRYGCKDARERLDIILQVEKDDLLSPYASLDRLYMKVLENAVSMDDDEYSSLLTHFQLVVGAVVLLFEPCPMSVLERLLGERQGCAKSILLQLGSVIIIPESNDDDVRVWHQSFVDFLTDRRRCHDPRFFINPEDHHHRLTLACLKCMCDYLKQNICSINPSMLNPEIDDLPTRLEQDISRELRYSCFHWSSHLSQSFSVGNTLYESLSSFCFEHLLHWIEVLSLFGELSLAIPALTNARKWCEVSGSDLRKNNSS